MNKRIQHTEDLVSLIDESYQELISTISDIRIDFYSPSRQWLSGVYKNILSERFEDEKTAGEERLKSLERSLKEFHFLEEVVFERYTEKMNRACIEFSVRLPDQIELELEESDFASEESDSSRIKGGKWIKRKYRSARNLKWKLGKLFSGRDGENQPEEVPMTRRVPLRELVRWHLLLEEDWIRQIMVDDYHFLSASLEALMNHQPENDKPGEEVEENGEGGREGAEDLEQWAERDFELAFTGNLRQRLTTFKADLDSRLESLESETHQRLQKPLEQIHRAVERSGSAGQPLRKYSDKHFHKRDKKRTESIQKLEEKWKKTFDSIAVDIQLQIELSLFGKHAARSSDELIKVVTGLLSDYCFRPMQSGIELTTTIVEQLEEEEKSARNKQLKTIREVHQVLEEELIDRLMKPDKSDEDYQERFSRMERIISDLQLESRRFSEEVVIAEKRELQTPDPVLATDTFNWGKLAGRFVAEQMIKKIQVSPEEFAAFLKEQFDEAREVAEVVDVNLLAALDDDEDTGADKVPLDVAIEGLERATGAMQKAIKETGERQDQYEKLIRGRVNRTLWDLSDMLHRREFDKFEFQDKAIAAKSRADNWKEAFSNAAALTGDKINLLWRFVVRKAKKWHYQVNKGLGFDLDEDLTEREKVELTEHLSETKTRLDTLPYIYQRLFDIDNVTDRRFFTIPDSAIQVCRTVLNKWKKGIHASVSVVGEKKSGKSRLMDILEEEVFTEEEVIRINFEETIYTEQELVGAVADALSIKQAESANELAEGIRNRGRKQVVILEGLENTYIRHMHGFEAQEHFWEIMSQTKEQILWIVTCSRYTWEYLDKVFNVGQYFSHFLETDTISREQIKKGILDRHKATGYELRFVPDPFVKASRAFRKVEKRSEKDVQAYLENLFFDKLASIAEGNMSVAMIYWIRAIESYDEKEFVLKPIEIVEVDSVKNLTGDLIFALAAIVLHSTLKPDELAMALHQPDEAVQKMVARLYANSLLEKHDESYTLNHLIYRQLLRQLKNRNLIH